VSERYTSYPRPVLWLVPEGEAPAATGGAAMGSRKDGAGAVVAPFYLSTLPVTNLQLAAALPAFARSPLAPGDDDPAVGVTHAEALAYCSWYARLARKAIRLPTEAEWEHACRAGRPTLWPWGEDWARADALVWHRGNSGPRVPDLSAKGSNAFGLYALLGGVWEWASCGDGAVLRGGSWLSPLEELARGARRVPTEARPADAGFRIAKSLRG
jgi:formylglycine-generating enzyme